MNKKQIETICIKNTFKRIELEKNNMQFNNCNMGYIDYINDVNGIVTIAGWGLQLNGNKASLPKSITFLNAGKIIGKCSCGVIRQDVVEAYPDIDIPINSGFRVVIPSSDIKGSPINTLYMYVEDNSGTFSTILGPSGMPAPLEPGRNYDEYEKYMTISHINTIALSLDSRCDLNCIYCSSRSKDYKLGKMSKNIIDNIFNNIQYMNVKEVHFNITGEPTISKNFIPSVYKCFDYNINVSITSNFSHIFTDEEVRLMARFSTIGVSIDTINIEKAKKIRKGSDVRTILYNILRIKASALLQNLSGPKFVFSTVLNEAVIYDFPELAAVAKIIGAVCMPLEMRKPFTDADMSTMPKLLSEMEDQKGCQAAIKKGMDILPGLHLDGNIVDTFILHKQDEKRNTRLCLKPWYRLDIYHTGKATPCFCFSAISQITEKSNLNDIINSDRIKRLRYELLSGNLSIHCQTCMRAKRATTSELRTLIENYYKTKGDIERTALLSNTSCDKFAW